MLLEPTGGWVEAGCQGTLHVRATFQGARAHSARPWMGANAIHRASDVLARLAAHEADTVDVDGLPYRESLQVVRIEGGIANNVVPDACSIVVNRRFAPGLLDRGGDRAQVEALLDGADEIEVINASPAAPPNLWDPLVAELIGTFDLGVRPKLGWTDVARFAAARRPRAELRSRRSRDRAHRGRARRPASRSTVATRCSVGSSASPERTRVAASEAAEDGDDLAVDRDLGRGRRPCPRAPRSPGAG